MSYYLDTNILYDTPAVFSSDKDLYVSAWVIFEIISGIKNEKTFNRRKKILQKLKNSNIKVIEHFHHTICSEVFSFSCWDIDDVKATMIFYKKILECESFNDFSNISFYVSNPKNIYDIQLFSSYDNLCTSDYNSLTSAYTSDSEQLLELRNIPDFDSKHPSTEILQLNLNYCEDFIKLYLFNSIMEGNYLEDIFEKCSENSFLKNTDENERKFFINTINSFPNSAQQMAFGITYYEFKNIVNTFLDEKVNNSILSYKKYHAEKRQYIFPSILRKVLANTILNAQPPHRNESQDLAHLYFIDHTDYFVSNDNFFKRFPCISNKVLNRQEFLEEHL